MSESRVATLARRIWGFIRSAPATYAYLSVLLVTSWILAWLGDARADRLLLSQSTNLHQLGDDPVRVLIGSAFWAPGAYALVLSALLFTVVLAPVERRIGSARTIGVFAIGHLGATLLTAVGLSVALRFDVVEHSIVNVRDVGTSYGFFAVAATLTYLLVTELRLPYAAALLGYLSATAVLAGGFGDYGHLTAAVLGFACYPLVQTAPHRPGLPLLDRLMRWAAARSQLRAEGGVSTNRNPD